MTFDEWWELNRDEMIADTDPRRHCEAAWRASIADTVGAKYTQADMERYGKCYADARDKRRADTAGAKAIYQVLEPCEAVWSDTDWLTYESTDGAFKRIVYLAATPASSVADAQDAARWREMLKHIRMWLSGGRRMVWAFGDGLPVPRETDYYKDSAAERFTQTIDAAIAVADKASRYDKAMELGIIDFQTHMLIDGQLGASEGQRVDWEEKFHQAAMDYRSASIIQAPEAYTRLIELAKESK